MRMYWPDLPHFDFCGFRNELNILPQNGAEVCHKHSRRTRVSRRSTGEDAKAGIEVLKHWQRGS